MLRSARARRSPIDVRRCLACGFGGVAAQRGDDPRWRRHPGERQRTAVLESEALNELPHCPRCGCDFRVRPPRTYAEMEGLDELAPESTMPLGVPHEARLVHRWIAFSFGAILICVIVVSLIVAALAPFVGIAN